MNDRKVCARSNSYMTFLEITESVRKIGKVDSYVEKCMHYLTRVDRWKAFVPVTNVEQEIRKSRITRIRAIKNGNDTIWFY